LVGLVGLWAVSGSFKYFIRFVWLVAFFLLAVGLFVVVRYCGVGGTSCFAVEWFVCYLLFGCVILFVFIACAGLLLFCVDGCSAGVSSCVGGQGGVVFVGWVLGWVARTLLTILFCFTVCGWFCCLTF